MRVPALPAAATLTGNEPLLVAQPSATVTITATTISALASDNSFNDSANGFIAAGFAVKQTVRVTGFTGSGANNIFAGVITALTAGKMTIGGTDGDVIVDDAAGESVTITKWDSVRTTAQDVADLAAGGSGATEFKGLTFTSSTASTADSDPGNGIFKWNNATQSSATTLYFDDQTADGVSLTTFWASLGTSGVIHLQQSDDATKWQLWKWTATPVDGTGYRKFTVTLQASGGSIADVKLCYAVFTGAGGGGGSTAGRQTIYVAAGSMTPSSSGGCGGVQRYQTSSGHPDFIALAFDSVTEESSEFSIRMPKKWNEGTITFDVAWTHSTAGAYGVVWELKAVAASDGDTLDAAFGTAVTVTDTGGSSVVIRTSPESSALTIAGSPAAGDMVLFKLSRKPTNGSDTLDVDALPLGINLYVTTDADTDA